MPKDACALNRGIKEAAKLGPTEQELRVFGGKKRTHAITSPVD